MRLFPILILAFLFNLGAWPEIAAQQDRFSWRLGVYGGVISYYGDLTPEFRLIQPTDRTIHPLENLDWETFGLSAEGSLGPAWGLGLSYTQGTFLANDRAIDWGGDLQISNENFGRSLNAQTELRSGSLYLVYYSDNDHLLGRNAFVAPYLKAGLGFTDFEVAADLYHGPKQDQRYYYWDDQSVRDLPQGSSGATAIGQDGEFETSLTRLQTEGEDYKTTVLSPSAALGLKFRLLDRLNLNIEYHIFFTQTDYLDDVSGRFLRKYDNPQQEYAANPADWPGTFRGDPEGGDDLFTFASLSLHYNFGRKKDAFLAPAIRVGLFQPALGSDTLSTAAPPVDSLPADRSSPPDTMSMILELPQADTLISRAELPKVDTGALSSPPPDTLGPDLAGPAPQDSSRKEEAPIAGLVAEKQVASDATQSEESALEQQGTSVREERVEASGAGKTTSVDSLADMLRRLEQRMVENAAREDRRDSLLLRELQKMTRREPAASRARDEVRPMQRDTIIVNLQQPPVESSDRPTWEEIFRQQEERIEVLENVLEKDRFDEERYVPDEVEISGVTSERTEDPEFRDRLMKERESAAESQIATLLAEVRVLRQEIQELKERPAPQEKAPAQQEEASEQIPEIGPQSIVYFALGSTALSAEALYRLQRPLQLLKDHSSLQARISGYADPSGNAAVNQRLARQRAQAVVQYFKDQGIGETRIFLGKIGIDRSVSSPAQGRRVELKLIVER